MIGPVHYALLDRIPIGICVLRRDLVVSFWNTCLEEWTGIPRDALLGQDLSARFPHLAEPKYLRRLQPIFDGGPPTVFSSQLHRRVIPAVMPDGRQRIQHTVVTSIPAADGSGFDALLSIQDVTDLTHRVDQYRSMRDQALLEVRERQRAEGERRAMEIQVQQAQKLESLGVLAGGIAHDFNNLLVGILGNADLALRDLERPHPVRETLEAIVKASQRAADLCNQMLAYSGKGKFVNTPLNLSEWTRDILHLLEISISKKARLDCRLAADLPAIEGDPTQIRQVVMNLITNASDALGDDSGTISLTTGTRECDRKGLRSAYLGEDRPAGRYVYLEVTDTGRGMDPETLAKIFDPFFTTKSTGRGLGLATVLGIVRSHRGVLEVNSEPGRGTTFVVLFPSTARTPAAAPASAPTTDSGWRTAETVLVVDDEEMVRLMAQTVLKRAGFTVLTAEDGQRCLEVFRQHGDNIAVVLLDMTMPNLSGDEAFRELRKIDPEVRVILTSGYTEQVAAERLADERLARFIQKPYRPAELLTLVREVLGSVAKR